MKLAVAEQALPCQSINDPGWNPAFLALQNRTVMRVTDRQLGVAELRLLKLMTLMRMRSAPWLLLCPNCIQFYVQDQAGTVHSVGCRSRHAV